MSLTLGKIKAMKKIKEEYQDICVNPIANIGVSVGLPNEDNIFEWRCTLIGPKDTSYAGGLFILNVKFPDNYPEQAPEICFNTPIYHLNVNPRKTKGESLGHICISTLNWWKPEYNMKKVLLDIFALFFNTNPESPYGLDRADEFRFKRALYEEKVKYFTKKYADPDLNKIYDNSDWVFSFN